VKHASSDDASDSFFHEKPEALFKRFAKQVAAPGGAGGGGATTANAGGAAGILDVFESARDAARRLANFATYYQMKSRAGDVGGVGLASLIKRVRARFPQIKLHLVGHSFGGRVVIAAANALGDNTPSVSVSLLQAAFSHNGLSENFLKAQPAVPGFFRDVIAKKRASGPIIITHTKNDTAVGIAYPLASRLAGQKAAAAALGDANDPFGGMGRNGAQRTKEAANTGTQLANAGHRYNFAKGSVYNLLADAFIADHSDIRKSQVAYAILCAASAV
jgi:pimeloyl-ACP methyl ester carboxylesterase